jgi:hypothetical protein
MIERSASMIGVVGLWSEIQRYQPGADNPEGEGTRIVMTHAGWDPDNDAVGRVTQGWGAILSHLRGFAETGRPDPYFKN